MYSYQLFDDVIALIKERYNKQRLVFILSFTGSD
jgi:hypothetical protein